MVVRVGINGFGRIGRVIFRTCLQNNDIELSAINDPAITAEYICYLIKFDSTHGKFNKIVNYANDEITVEDHVIKIFHEKMPSSVPWQTAGVQYVIEASGMFTTLEKASGHMKSDGVRRVIVTAPSVDVPMIILGVNDFTLRPDQRVLSCASSTLYCLAPIIKVLEDHFGVAEGFVTSIHAMTPSLKPLDGLCLRGKHWRDHRSIHQNIIPATTGACKALGKIIPQVKDKMSGLAFRVPIVNVSVLDITMRLKTNTTLQEIVKNIENASNTSMKNIIKVSSDETVSSDYIGESHSCIFDSESSLQLKPNFYKLICWYENEHSYACRVIDSIFYSEQLLSLVRISSKMTYVRAKPSKMYDVVQQTECLSKEISVECKFNADLCSTSQDTGLKSKEPQRVGVLKKPLSAHISGTAAASMGGRDTKRRNEIFKIWKDGNDISKSCVRQNRGSFFHSCISFAPQDIQPSNMKVTERLETVRRDVFKMTDRTDDLLKSCTKKADSGVTFPVDNMTENTNTSLNISHEEPTKECAVKSHIKVISARIFDISGDYQAKMEVADNKILEGSSKEKLIRTYDSYNKEMSDHTVSTRKDPSMPETDTLCSTTKLHNNSQISMVQEVTKTLKSDIHTIQSAKDAPIKLNDDNVFKEQVAKAITTLIDGLEQSFHVPHQSDQENFTKKGTVPVKKELKENCVNDKTDMISKKTNGFVNKENVIQNIKIENKFLLENHSTDHKIAHMFKKDKYKFKTATETKYKIIHSNKKLNKKQLVRSPAIQKLTTEIENKDDKYFAKQILEGLNRVSPDPVLMIREDKTPSLSPDRVNSRNFNLNVPKQDIFDKLDSVSETDSENSFEIHGRKSQVIHITDLTKSLEDLANLDKICRIIEISDELSDKLFSALNTADGLRQKKWSFKDLCERIKLDEFCNKVFGKSVL